MSLRNFNPMRMCAALPPRRRLVLLAAAIMAIGAIAYGTLQADAWLSSAAFCSKACHEMENHVRLFEAQGHSVGVVGGCSGCHVRPGPVGHACARLTAIPHVYEHFFGNPDPASIKASAHQLTLINERCTSCHAKRRTADPRHLPLANAAALATASGGTVGVRCTDCHPSAGHYDGRYDGYSAKNSDRKTPAEASREVECLACHTTATPEVVAGWMAGPEAGLAKGCNACHDLRHDAINRRTTGALCPMRASR